MSADPADRQIRLLLVEEDRAIRRALCMALRLEPDLAIVAASGDRAQALELARTLQPDVVLADLPVPERGGVTLVAELREAAPCGAVVILSHFDGAIRRRQAAELGATAFVGKHEPFETLLDTIRCAASLSQD